MQNDLEVLIESTKPRHDHFCGRRAADHNLAACAVWICSSALRAPYSNKQLADRLGDG